MSAHALSSVWDATELSAEEKLLLFWVANNTGELGHPVMIDPHGMGEFIGSGYCRATDVLDSLCTKGFLRWGTVEDETSSYVWLTNESGIYHSPIDWLGETKSRSKRVTALIERDGPCCAYCDRTPINYHVDHFVPKAKGGEDRMGNLVLACPDCNLAKRDKYPEEFLQNDPHRFYVISTNLKHLHE